MLNKQEFEQLNKIILNHSHFLKNRSILVEYSVLYEILSHFIEKEKQNGTEETHLEQKTV